LLEKPSDWIAKMVLNSSQEYIMNHVENLTLLLFNISQASSVPALIGVTAAYFKSNYSTSISMKACKVLQDLFEVEEPQAGEDWLVHLRSIRTNWRGIVDSEGFAKLSKLLSLVCSIGLCESASLTFSVGGYELFAPKVASKHKNAFDVIDAAVDTVIYFVEVGHCCYKQRSLKPMFYSNAEIMEFEDNFALIREHLEFVRCGNLEKFGTLDENDFSALLDQLLEQAKTLHLCATREVERQLIQRRLDDLKRMHATFVQIRSSGGLRVSPFCIAVYGESGVGKSSIADPLMHSVLKTNGYADDPTRLITLNADDPYMSNYRSHINGMFIDDLGNKKAAFCKTSPVQIIIDTMNNVKNYANMAEADMKGKVSIEPKACIITSNVKDLCARQFSNKPTSIVRRAHYMLTASVKPEFSTNTMLDSRKAAAYYEKKGITPPDIEDLWFITVEECVPKIKKPGSERKDGAEDDFKWVVVSDAGGPLKDVDFPRVVRYLLDQSRPYYKHQNAIVAKAKDAKYEMCPECNYLAQVCLCKKSPHFGVESLMTAYSIKRAFGNSLNMAGAGLLTSVDQWTSKQLLAAYSEFNRYPLLQWTTWVPNDWWSNPLMTKFIYFTRKDELTHNIKCVVWVHAVGILCASVAAKVRFEGWVIVAVILAINLAYVVEQQKAILMSHLERQRDSIPLVVKSARDQHMQTLLKTCVGIAAAYALCKAYKAFHGVRAPQGNLQPTTAVEIQERDDEVNAWAKIYRTPRPVISDCKTATHDQVKELVKHNLVYFRYQDGDAVRCCDALFVCSNVCIIPRHMWQDYTTLNAEFVRHDPGAIGGNFKAIIARCHSVDLTYNGEATDLTLVWVPSGGSWKDLTPFMSHELPESSVPTKMVWKNKEGSCVEAGALMVPGIVNNGVEEFSGFSYNLSVNTFVGLCIGTFISQTRIPTICGVHLGGKTGTPVGCAGLLTAPMIREGMAALRKPASVLLAKSDGEIPETLYDKTMVMDKDHAPKSPLRFMPHSNIRVYGCTLGGVSYKSNCVKALLSDEVEKRLDIKNIWGPPKFKPDWKPWQESLQHSANPSIGVEPSILDLAVTDFLEQFLGALEKSPIKLKSIKPLTRMQTVCGVDGKRFLDKMNPASGIGVPLTGPKSDYLHYLEPEDGAEFECPAELTGPFWDHVEKIKVCYASGVRGHFFFKACLKDEPTDQSKTKVRVFQASSAVGQLLTRQYFLPFCRLLSLFPFDSECAVGINPFSQEWEQLHQHVTKFGSDRILAGDYSKYDLRMPAQLMFAAFRILIEVARKCDYSEEDISMMEGIATDICYAVTCYNGDLIQHIGSNPSGQNLTVYINSIVNSLLFRCAYYDLYQGRDVPPFKEVCSLITYGDDAKSSVSDKFPEFDFFAVQRYLAANDMVFTMPDKTSAGTSYMKDEQADFLKRRSVYNAELGYHMGALDVMSIAKSLHCNLRSKVVSQEEQAMSCVTGALYEMSAHGRELYEYWRHHLKEACDAKDIGHGVPALNRDYDQMIAEFKEKYLN
jgi:hypothetical protein